MNFNFLLRFHIEEPEDVERKSALNMATGTLDMMAKGGIFDHVSKVMNSSDSFGCLISLLQLTDWKQ